MKTIKRRILFILLLLASSSIIAQQINVEPNFQQAVKYFNAGQYEMAKDYFNNSLKVMPESGFTYYYLGYINLFNNQIDKAGEAFKNANEYSPNEAIILAAYGNYFTEIRDYKKATQLLDKAIKANPAYAESYNNKGVLLTRSGEHRAALDYYNLAIKYDTTFAMAYCNRGTARYYNQDVADASKSDIELTIKDYNKALELEPTLMIAIKNRAIAYEKLGLVKEALQDINTFIAKKPKDANGYYERGKIYSKNKDYSNAIDDFMAALIYKPDYAEAYLQMGNAKMQLKYYEEALKDIARAMVYKEDIIPFGHYKLASIYALVNNKNRMMYNLNQSFAKKYFSQKINFEDFINDEDFKNYKTDKDFIAFKNKLKSKLK